MIKMNTDRECFVCVREIFKAKRDMIMHDLAVVLTDVCGAHQVYQNFDHLFLLTTALEEIQRGIEPVMFSDDNEINHINMELFSMTTIFKEWVREFMMDDIARCQSAHTLH